MRLAGSWLGRFAVFALLAAAPLGFGNFRVFLLTEILIFGLFAASLDLLIGYSGLPSLGHAAYLGIGAYATALLGTHVTSNVFAQMAVGIGSATVVAAATGWLAVRTRGVYFLMLTLAFSQLLFTLGGTWDSVTHGSNGLTGVPGPTLAPGDTTLVGQNAFFYYVLVVFAFGYLFLRALVASPFGRALAGIRENESRMASIGYAVPRYKLAAFCLAGAVAGLAGVLTVQQFRYVSPSGISFKVSALALVAVVIGGRATLWGPVVGAAFVYELRDELSSHFAQHWELVLGLVFMLVVYLLPRGIGGLGTHAAALVGRRVVVPAAEELPS